MCTGDPRLPLPPWLCGVIRKLAQKSESALECVGLFGGGWKFALVWTLASVGRFSPGFKGKKENKYGGVGGGGGSGLWASLLVIARMMQWPV